MKQTDKTHMIQTLKDHLQYIWLHQDGLVELICKDIARDGGPDFESLDDSKLATIAALAENHAIRIEEELEQEDLERETFFSQKVWQTCRMEQRREKMQMHCLR